MPVKKTIIIFVLGLFARYLPASHLLEANMHCDFVKKNGSVCTFKFEVHVYRDCSDDGTANAFLFDDSITVCMFNSTDGSFYKVLHIKKLWAGKENPNFVHYAVAASTRLEHGLYIKYIDLDENTSGSYLSYQRCCRPNFVNLQLAAQNIPYQGIAA